MADGGITQDELTRALEDAAGEVMAPATLPGFSAVEVTRDVKLGELVLDGVEVGLWPGLTIPGGSAFVVDADETSEVYGQGADGTPAILVPSKVEVDDETARAMREGRDVVAKDGKTPLVVSFEPINARCGKALTMNDIATWAAAASAADSGDDERAGAILAAVYGRFSTRAVPDIPQQDTKALKKHIQGISKVDLHLPDMGNGEIVDVDVSGRNERGVFTRFSLTYDGDGISIDRPITPFDRSVHNAVTSLIVCGNTYVTVPQVCRALTGKVRPGKSTMREVEKSLEKQRKTLVSIDFSQEMRGRTGEFNGQKNTQYAYEIYMLDAGKVSMKSSNGDVVLGYKINSFPILYQHDVMTGQITSCPQRVLTATGEAVSATETNITIRDYLIGRIARMSNKGSRTSRNILYDTIFSNIGRGDASPKDRRRMVESVRRILDAFKGEGFISGWSEYREEGRSHRTKGVSINTSTKRNAG
jgi:hypothetical protein